MDEAYQEAAANDLGLTAKELDSEQKKDVSELAKEIEGLNEGLVPQFATVMEGAVLKLPGNKEHTAEQTATLGTYAEKLLGSADKATLLFDLNEKQVEAAKTLPAGTKLKLPQHNAPALILFGLLMVFLTLVGLGWLLQAPAAEPRNGQASSETAYDIES